MNLSKFKHTLKHTLSMRFKQEANNIPMSGPSYFTSHMLLLTIYCFIRYVCSVEISQVNYNCYL